MQFSNTVTDSKFLLKSLEVECLTQFLQRLAALMSCTQCFYLCTVRASLNTWMPRLEFVGATSFSMIWVEIMSVSGIVGNTKAFFSASLARRISPQTYRLAHL